MAVLSQLQQNAQTNEQPAIYLSGLFWCDFHHFKNIRCRNRCLFLEHNGSSLLCGGEHGKTKLNSCFLLKSETVDG